jgi:hypothetical protein
MNEGFRFTIGFSGITVRFVLPGPIVLPKHFALLQCEDVQQPDACYTLELLSTPLAPTEPMVRAEGEARIYHTEKGWLHIYPALGDGIGCQVACLFCPGGSHRIYYPASRWEEYSRVWNCTHLICGEQLLLQNNALLLHSSVVFHEGKAILFSGPSGAGKSTQAQLWQEHLGARIINGDRTVIRKTPEGFLAGGSMWSGSSGIFSPDQAPIGGICLVEHGSENKLQLLGFEAFKPLLTQTLVNSWDPEFMDRVVSLLSELMDAVPIYRLSCRPDQSAVELVYDTLFPQKGVFHEPLF